MSTAETPASTSTVTTSPGLSACTPVVCAESISSAFIVDSLKTSAADNAEDASAGTDQPANAEDANAKTDPTSAEDVDSGSGQDSDIKLELPNVQYTNIDQVGPTLGSGHIERFFGAATKTTDRSMGWIVALLATPNTFNENTMPTFLHHQYIFLLQQCSSLLEARHEIEKVCARHAVLRNINFVAIPVGQAVALSLDVAPEEVDTSIYKTFVDRFEGNADYDDDTEREFEETVQRVDAAVEANRPVYLRKVKRNSLSLKKWEQIVDITIKMANEKKQQVSTMFQLHIDEIHTREYALSKAFLERYLELYEKTRARTEAFCTIMLSRFGPFMDPQTEVDLRNQAKEFNHHLNVIEFKAMCWEHLPFDISEVRENHFFDKKHEEYYSNVIGKGALSVLQKEGDGMVHISRTACPLFVYISKNPEGNLEQRKHPASKEDLIKHIKDNVGFLNGVETGCVLNLGKIKAELARIDTEFEGDTVKYAEYMRNLFRQDPDMVNNPQYRNQLEERKKLREEKERERSKLAALPPAPAISETTQELADAISSS